MKRKLFLSLTLPLVLLFTSCSSYNKVMTKALRKSLGKDFKEYSSFSYPTDNFGVLTSFDQELSPSNQICAMASCITGLELNSPEEWINLKGLVNVGTGGTITLTETQQKDVSIDAVLPKLWSILNVSGGFNKNSTQKVTLDIGPGTVRFVNKLKLKETIDNLPDTDLFKQKYINGDLVVAVSDVVVQNMTVTIEIDSNASANLEASISNEDIDSGDLDFTYKKVTNGKYVFEIKKPVIIMRLTKKQPSAGVLGEEKDFDDWIAIKDFLN